MDEDVLSKIKSMLAPILERESLTLYDLELAGRGGRKVLSVYIDKEGGVNHGDCKSVSEQLSALLEVEDVIPGAYTLEVSSPGLTRKLKKEEHFVKSAGSLAKVTFRKGFAGPQTAVGRLSVLENGRFALELLKDGKTVEFGFDDVARARLEMEEFV